MNRVIPGMASLQDYVTRQFPQHDIDVLEPRTGSDLELTDNTVVSFVVGNRAGLDLLSTFRRSAPNAKVAAVEVRPSDRSVVPREDEDRDSVIDLPAKRVAAYVLIGLVTFGVIATVVAWMIADSGMTAAIYGCFAALVGAIVGAIVGGSRFAGERATSQPRVPGRKHHRGRSVPRRQRSCHFVGTVCGARSGLRGSHRRPLGWLA